MTAPDKDTVAGLLGTVTNCCVCGRIIDTRETTEGGDPFGCQHNDERWTCSDECGETAYPPPEWMRTHLAPDLAAAWLADQATIAAQAERIKALEEALTPSGDTKAAYMGEFKFPVTSSDEDGEEVMANVYVPWTTIKEIMAGIRARAALSKGDKP